MCQALGIVVLAVLLAFATVRPPGVQLVDVTVHAVDGKEGGAALATSSSSSSIETNVSPIAALVDSVIQPVLSTAAHVRPPLINLGANTRLIEATIRPDEDWLVCFTSPTIAEGYDCQMAIVLVLKVYLNDDRPLHGAIVQYRNDAERKALKRYWPLEADSGLRLFVGKKPDRSCLLTPPPPQLSPSIEVPLASDEQWPFRTISLLNDRLGRHRTIRGELDSLGQLIKEIRENLYNVSASTATKCDIIDYDSITKDEFIRDYVSRSRPVILRGAAKTWPALTLWTNDYLTANLGAQDVHIKLTPNGEFEGCESINLWPGGNSHIPESVRRKLAYDDIVVVRPAPVNMKFAYFMEMLNSNVNVSAYLEYTSISAYLPKLLENIDTLGIAEDLVQEHLNIWLGNGKTIGKLHFDQFENLLSQVTGAKEFIIYPPHENENLYEGHLAEAQLSFDLETLEFSRDNLLESTSMVMSPVDIVRPDYGRYPRFARTKPLSCTVTAGDAIYLPSFWWHEVRSKPDADQRNIAVNYWFKPVLDKEFPCRECRVHPSPAYYDLLMRVHGRAAPPPLSSTPLPPKDTSPVPSKAKESQLVF